MATLTRDLTNTNTILSMVRELLILLKNRKQGQRLLERILFFYLFFFAYAFAFAFVGLEKNVDQFTKDL